MKKWALIVDVERCSGCYNCVLANQDEHIDNDFPGYAAPQPKQGSAWIRIERVVRGSPPMVDAAYVPQMCNHCDNAPCVAAGRGAVNKRDDGIVIIDPVRARGRRDLVDVCPYGAVRWNEALQLPQIWIFDAHLLDQGWREPRCVQACPTGALEAAKLSDAELAARVNKDELAPLRAGTSNAPRVFYRNLHRAQSHFLGGSVLAQVDGRIECVEGAEVSLYAADGVATRMHTDVFGDFKFDSLGAGRYRIEIHHRFGAIALEAELRESLYLGALPLGKQGGAEMSGTPPRDVEALA